MPQYLMARHVFLCMQGEHVVFLDVRKDRYFALESARTAGLGHFVPGWPVRAPMVSDAAHHNCESAAPALTEQLDHSALSGVISLLLGKGILTIEGDSGKPANETVAEPIRADLGADSLDETPRPGMFRLLRFASAAVRARMLLKYRTFEVVVERVRRRRESMHASRPAVSESDLQPLVASFAILRPFFFAARDACLFDALALGEFLAGYGVYPQWVFGVQSRPFAAHCWLQLDGVVLNDTVDHVKRYTPIMVV